MKPLDTFHPVLDTPENDTGPGGCSAHYFEIEGPLLGAGWYGQGLRLLDISDAEDLRQVGYYRVTGTGTDNPSSNSWDMAFYDWGSKRAVAQAPPQQRPDLPLRHDPRRRGPCASSGGPRRRRG